MKKILSMILALAMILSLGVTAFAAETTGSWDGTTYTGNTADVTASYTAGTTTVVNVCKVDISWTVTNGSKTVGNVAYTWNATEHKYVAGAATGESTTNPSVKVTLTNHSDIALYADITYADNTTDEVTSSATAIENVELDTGVTVTDNDYSNATYTQPAGVERTMDITITDWSKLTQANQVIGTVTVTLSKTA